MKNRNRLIYLIFVFGMSSIIAAYTPEQRLRQMIDKVVKIARSSSSAASMDKQLIVGLRPYIDTYSIARAVVGRQVWGKAGSQDRNQFVSYLEAEVISTYAKELKELARSDISFQGRIPSSGQKYAQVSMSTRNPNGSISKIVVFFRKSGSWWKVVDSSYNGVSLVGQYREEYKDIISSHGLKGIYQQE